MPATANAPKPSPKSNVNSFDQYFVEAEAKLTAERAAKVTQAAVEEATRKD